MTRRQEVIETISCDLCGRPADEDLTVTLGWDTQQWRVDLCPTDYKRIAGQFDKWIANSESTPAKTRARRNKSNGAGGSDDWVYLESLGFTRHRGRKNAAEVEALASRAP